MEDVAVRAIEESEVFQVQQANSVAIYRLKAEDSFNDGMLMQGEEDVAADDWDWAPSCYDAEIE